ncbi:MAG: serine hydrolase, partial [Bacteroidota bacterium]
MKLTNTSISQPLLAGLFIFLSVNLFAQSAVVDPATVGLSAERLARLDAFIEKDVVEGKIPGAVSLVYRKGKIAHQKAYGYTNLETKEKMPLNEIFYIQSMTKPIVTAALMMLYEEGHFQLNDPIAKYFPAFKEMSVAKFIQVEGSDEKEMQLEPADKPITIAHCMSHTAGFSHGLGASKIDQMYLRALYFQPHKTIEDRVMAMAKLPLVAHPDNVWYYSAGPDVLALLIEHFSGKSCAEFLKERLFDPLDMDDTGYVLDPSKNDRIATLYHMQDGKLTPFVQRQPKGQGETVFGGTHALFSTAADYMKFAQMLLNGGQGNGQQLLGKKTIELMTTDRVGDKWSALGFGFGLGFGVKTDLAASADLASE